jgi:hypothetical protein
MLLKDEWHAVEGLEAWKKDVDAQFFRHNLPFL